MERKLDIKDNKNEVFSFFLWLINTLISVLWMTFRIVTVATMCFIWAFGFYCSFSVRIGLMDSFCGFWLGGFWLFVVFEDKWRRDFCEFYCSNLRFWRFDVNLKCFLEFDMKIGRKSYQNYWRNPKIVLNPVLNEKFGKLSKIYFKIHPKISFQFLKRSTIPFHSSNPSVKLQHQPNI